MKVRVRRPVLKPEFKLCQPLPRLSLDFPGARLGGAALRHGMVETTAILEARAAASAQGANQISASI
jgi:hypothetical protein